MKPLRRRANIVRIGTVKIGGSYPVAIQSMIKTRTADVDAAIAGIRELAGAGCDIVRLAVKDMAEARSLKEIKRQSPIPLVADIHFDWRLALVAIDSGVDKIRLNPGNIYKREQVRDVVTAAKRHRIPIRIGINSGSLPDVKGIPAKGDSASDRMVCVALRYIRMIERFGFDDLVISLKASNIADTVAAYRSMSERVGYPLHLGVTATGAPYGGALKSAVGIGALLLDGIGDTIRVSLTAPACEEVRAALAILEATGHSRQAYEIISCPTCGRCEVDILTLVRDLEVELAASNAKLRRRPLKVAVMGCVVNGPGEAGDADIGIAFGKKEGLLFKNGKAIRKVSPNEAVAILRRQIKGLKRS